ncbi:hypothetical protein Sjap_008053 [Stephania japonica]|uniref:Uncharacterized protein n=1 Tax=Stephania japonica TaxID=461633 RepID=A0AAP0JP62_9MAGN
MPATKRTSLDIASCGRTTENHPDRRKKLNMIKIKPSSEVEIDPNISSEIDEASMSNSKITDLGFSPA